MKKTLILVIAVVLAAALLCACAAPAASSSALQSVRSKGKLVMGMDDAFPPMGFRDDSNQIVGFDVDVAAEVAKRMGVELVPTPIDWSQKINELNTGNVDVIWNGFTITEERLEQTAMSKAYMKNKQVIVVLTDSGVNTLADLAGKTVALQAESSAEDALESKPDFKASLKEVVLLDDNMTALMDLEVKGCDAVLMDSIVANYYITANAKNFKVLDESLADEEFGIGCKKGGEDLRDEINKQLDAMAADGTLAEISNKWFGIDVTTVGK